MVYYIPFALGQNRIGGILMVINRRIKLSADHQASFALFLYRNRSGLCEQTHTIKPCLQEVGNGLIQWFGLQFPLPFREFETDPDSRVWRPARSPISVATGHSTLIYHRRSPGKFPCFQFNLITWCSVAKRVYAANAA